MCREGNTDVDATQPAAQNHSGSVHVRASGRILISRRHERNTCQIISVFTEVKIQSQTSMMMSITDQRPCESHAVKYFSPQIIFTGQKYNNLSSLTRDKDVFPVFPLLVFHEI